VQRRTRQRGQKPQSQRRRRRKKKQRILICAGCDAVALPDSQQRRRTKKTQRQTQMQRLVEGWRLLTECGSKPGG
jgi:hypothetical protein